MSEAPTTTLFVGRLSSTATQRDVEDLFSKYGKLQRCFLKDKGPQSYAFVTFEDSASATKAFEELQGVELNGNKINIEKAKSSDRPRGPRSGGAGGGHSSSSSGSPHSAYAPPAPYGYPAPYPDTRAAPYYSIPMPRGSSRRSRSRSPPRGYGGSPYDHQQRPYEHLPYGYPPAPYDPAAAAGYPPSYPYPPHPAAYDPYAAYPPSAYAQAPYGYAAPVSTYPGAYAPQNSASNRSRSPYRSGSSRSPVPRERGGYNRRPRVVEDSSNGVSAVPASTSVAAPVAYAEPYPAGAQ